MKCATVQHGGVCHRASSPNKNWNMMKEKKKEEEGANTNRPYIGPLYLTSVFTKDRR